MGDDEIPVCPKCDSASISSTNGHNYPNPAADHGWRCKRCAEGLDAPDYREPHSDSNQTRSGLAKTLLDADPDEWP